jgi:hypothetical protein
MSTPTTPRKGGETVRGKNLVLTQGKKLCTNQNQLIMRKGMKYAPIVGAIWNGVVRVIATPKPVA